MIQKTNVIINFYVFVKQHILRKTNVNETTVRKKNFRGNLVLSQLQGLIIYFEISENLSCLG